MKQKNPGKKLKAEITKDEKIIMFICWLVYVAAYIGRLNYSATIVAIIADRGFSKAEAGLAYSFFAFAYGIGQFVNGMLSSKYNNRVMVFASLTVSSFLNMAMTMYTDASALKYIWLLNGAVQSVLWSTLVKTIAEHVSDKGMPTAIMAMSTSNTFGTFIVYGISALFVRFTNWKWSFYFASICLIVTAFIWFFLYGNREPLYVKPEVKKEKSKIGFKSPMFTCVVVIALAGIANGFIKDGVNTWVPSVLYESFGINQSFSILLTLMLPLIATLSAGVIKYIHTRISSHNEMDALLYVFSAILSLGIIFSLRFKNLITIMLCFVLLSATMSMVNNVITSIFPLDRRKFIGSGMAAGLLNTFCYVGSTVTSYSLGVVSEKGGWNAVFTIMLVISAAAAAISLAGIKADRKISLEEV
ncbi:MAG: MFS transporter [Clostridiales bacterium]|nr:MFS transporter [Clostridiales bacterium]